MGVIVTITDGSKMYYSTNGQSITTTKLPKGTHALNPDATSPPEWEYYIDGVFVGWNNEEDYTLKNPQTIITRTNVHICANTLPTNNYTELYTQFKNILATTNHRDDI